MIFTIADYVDDIAKKNSTKTAFVDKYGVVSFKKLQHEVHCVAMSLIYRGLEQNPIAIFLTKCTSCISVMLGIAYSRNSYTPIDTSLPDLRIKKLLSILKPALVITDNEHLARVQAISMETEAIVYDDILNVSISELALAEQKRKIKPTDILYILFTSGTTGIPKGVTMCHQAVIAYVEWLADEFGINSDNVLGNQSPLHFDLSIQDVYAPIILGCSTYLIDQVAFKQPSKLMEELCNHSIDIIFWVPSALCLLADMKALKAEKKPKLKKIFFCGEVMPTKYLNKWRSVFTETMFINLYGPSEACDACMFYVVERNFSDEEVLPLGRASRHMEIFLLDEEGNKIQESDKIGEIFIGGIGLSNGYHNDKIHTDECFLQNPLCQSHREIIYRTGDLAKRDADGNLIYVSRRDFQIKHLGHRIELGEIESWASSVEGVNLCCCIYDRAENKIVLYYTGNECADEIDKVLQDNLPIYMIPRDKIHLTVMPLNSNGKIDRNLLSSHTKSEGGMMI